MNNTPAKEDSFSVKSKLNSNKIRKDLSKKDVNKTLKKLPIRYTLEMNFSSEFSISINQKVSA